MGCTARASGDGSAAQGTVGQSEAAAAVKTEATCPEVEEAAIGRLETIASPMVEVTGFEQVPCTKRVDKNIKKEPE